MQKHLPFTLEERGRKFASVQEVKKSGKPPNGKPPLGKRLNDRQLEASCPLFPSSSSASLDSLGDSKISVASARSLNPAIRPHPVQSSIQQACVMYSCLFTEFQSRQPVLPLQNNENEKYPWRGSLQHHPAICKGNFSVKVEML